MEETHSLARSAGRAAVTGGVLGLASLVAVLAGEASEGTDFMSTTAAALAGWAGFVASALLVVGLIGLAVRYGGTLATVGRVALQLLALATAITVGASSTLALIVPTLADTTPELVESPPSTVPATFILSGLVMGVCSIVLAVHLRRRGVASRAATTMMIIGGVVTMVPLPSRFFLLALAVGLLVLRPAPQAAMAVDGDPALVG